MRTQNITNFSGLYAFLSNFYPANVRYQGINYPSTEHAYQAAKTLDVVERFKISKLHKPSRAKMVGQTVKCRADWEAIKVEVMREILFIKFEDVDFNQALLQTGDVLLVEGNTWGDTFWGVCDGVGWNHLGMLLMEVRKAYRYFESDDDL